MLSVAWRGKAPYKAVMTHGFVVDKDTGKKTSKSDAKSGKPIDAALLLRQVRRGHRAPVGRLRGLAE